MSRAAIECLGELCQLQLAEKWDNVGLLVDCAQQREKDVVLFTNDLTDSVMKEAIEKNCNLIVSYHPRIFRGLKKLEKGDPSGRIVMACIKNGIGLFCPHTSLDSVAGGVNDWILSCFPSIQGVSPITPSALVEGAGLGRLGVFDSELSLDKVISTLKAHFGVDSLQVVLPEGVAATAEVKCSAVAVCAGSGSSVLKGTEKRCDLWITGELSHHDMLHAAANGMTVVLPGHTATERGFLPVFAERFAARSGCEVLVSLSDKQPFIVV